MRFKTSHTLRASILCLALLLAACGQQPSPAATPVPTPAPPEPSRVSGEEWRLVVIGDSSMWELGQAYAAQIEADLGVKVTLADYALPGLSAGEVLEDLRRETPPYRRLSPEAIDALRQAHAVVMFTNPLHPVDPDHPLDILACFGNRAPALCDPEAFEPYIADLKAIWAEILDLRGGQPVVLRATDSYNPLVSDWREAGVFDACTDCWQNLSDAARLAAEAYNIPFLSRFDAFNGPDHDEDPREKGYILPDGQHPTELAGQFAAGLLAQMGYEPVSPPPTSGPQATPQSDAGQAAASPYPLAEPGPYFTGKVKAVFQDASRADRQVAVSVWYPALLPEGASGEGARLMAGKDRDPDPSGAPYPLIVSSTKMAQDLAPYLVSHGFTWASVDGIDTYPNMNEEMVDQPLDILFALDQVALYPPEGLQGMIDAEHAGAIGYSFDGYNTLALSGARVDPEHYLALCADPNAEKPHQMSGFSCGPALEWEAYTAYAGPAVTSSQDGLWQPMTDPRILAVMPMACEGWWLFGERGLAAADRPALFLAGTGDELYPENVQIFEHLGTDDKVFVSFAGRDHMMIYDMQVRARIAHFAAAFFGYHLQGKEDLAAYFSEGFVRQHEDLAWGVYGQE